MWPTSQDVGSFAGRNERGRLEKDNVKEDRLPVIIQRSRGKRDGISRVRYDRKGKHEEVLT